MTMTPLDVYAFTGIASEGSTFRIDVPLQLSEVGIVGALGWLPVKQGPGDTIPQSTLLTRLASERERVAFVGGQMTRQEAHLYARIFLLLRCQEMFESHGEDTTHRWWLPYFSYFDQIYDYDWGGFILAVLYDSMDQISRHMAVNVKGFSIL